MNPDQKDAGQYARLMIAGQVELVTRRYADFMETLLREHGATEDNANTFSLIKDHTELGGIFCRAGQALGTITVRIDAHGLKIHFEPSK